ncbi:MAG TPA: hypothetical protein VFJ61_01285 [Solirubrobacterales bacterium]|nr:hypothetical protein [Solirubrobacterales bacterium]
MGKDLLYKVAYDEAVRALSEQAAVVDGLRSRAGVLFSAAAITTSFLGARAVQDAHWSPFSWLALATFVGVAAAFLAILWPRRWEVAANPNIVVKAYIESEEPISIEDLHRELSFHLYGSYLENRPALERLVVYFQIANVLFAVELVLWIAAVAFTA